jgi:hypothetical protein
LNPNLHSTAGGNRHYVGDSAFSCWWTPDVVEEKNLNRICGATWEDAELKRPKVEVLARAARAMGLAGVAATSFSSADA